MTQGMLGFGVGSLFMLVFLLIVGNRQYEQEHKDERTPRGQDEPGTDSESGRL